MSRDHFIPQFILRGFSINPTANKSNQKIMIFDRENHTIEKKRIVESFSINDYNSQETEKFLAQNYESTVSRIFQLMTQSAINNEKNFTLSNDEYRLLNRFFVIMWRRNNIHLDRAKEIGNQLEIILKSVFGNNYQNMLNPKYKDYSFEKMFEEKKQELSKNFFDSVIPSTTDNDPTVLKTIKHYIPHIIYNKSNVHFILHNTYATLRYFISKDQVEITENDHPFFFIYPVSNTLCICTKYVEEEIDITQEDFKIPIEVWDDDNAIKQFFIHDYITETATCFVIDNSNEEYIRQLFQ